MSASEHVRVTVEDGVMAIVLDRPSRKNALSRAMYTAMADALARAGADPAVRCVRLSGAGGVFSSGNDLQDFMEDPPGPDGGPIGAFLRVLVGFEKPLVAAVSGHAVGIGTTVLLHCDLAWADDTATFKMPFTSLGLVPEAGSSLILPAMVGHRRAAELLMLGRSFDAATAAELGIVNGVCEADALDATVDQAVAELVALPAGALRATKRLMKGRDRAGLEAAMADEAGEFIARLQSPEAMEAFMAFFQKRQPDFRQFA
ncbi:MAG: enoyl-CoA hydratase [Alphaproteobacteria bacterium]|nr:enoyl-CoA hydratase [Alphaproteobacteria bacterium]